ncbi:hypothetical protein CSB07_00510 [Candidatus Gracilibacteria bacterium]|nr:MAG: hypothetical protein CSB07_00510 [Candidatus Gracilibacteria bacterium]PIE85612.1 MAG: hypothetical protein CSA08_00975 [Candidatus Gracilibacteria bacterium]
MDLAKSIKNTGKEEVIIKSIVWNTIIGEFLKEKNIDITEYLVSISINKKTISVKTFNPLINSELLFIENKIKEESIKKITKLGLKFCDFEIKFI